MPCHLQVFSYDEMNPTLVPLTTLILCCIQKIRATVSNVPAALETPFLSQMNLKVFCFPTMIYFVRWGDKQHLFLGIQRLGYAVKFQ